MNPKSNSRSWKSRDPGDSRMWGQPLIHTNGVLNFHLSKNLINYSNTMHYNVKDSCKINDKNSGRNLFFRKFLEEPWKLGPSIRLIRWSGVTAKRLVQRRLNHRSTAENFFARNFCLKFFWAHYIAFGRSLKFSLQIIN